jgi:translocation and assembly module TamB
LAFEDLALDVGGGLVTAALSIEETRAAGRADVKGLPLETLAVLLPEARAEGMLSASATLSGNPANPTVLFSVRATDIERGVGLEAEIPEFQASLDGVLENGRLAMAGEITGLPEAPVRVEAEMPLALSFRPLTASVPATEPFSARLDGMVDIGQIEDLLPLGDDRAAGVLDVSIAATGNLRAPQIAGRASLSAGVYENIESGAVLHDISASIASFGSTVIVEELRANDGQGGSLMASGGLDLSPDGAIPIDLSAKLDNLLLLQRDEITAPVSGDVFLRGDMKGLRLAGALTIPAAEIGIPEQLPADVVALDVIEINAVAPIEVETTPAETSSEQTRAALKIALDVGIDMPGKIFVRGRGLDSEWKGRLHIGGSTEQPEITGALELVRGRFDFVDKVFMLKGGTITFMGEAPPDPDIAIQAEAKADGILTTVALSGRASAPELTLASEPPLPQDEILSFLLFGKSASEISAFQAAQLANAAATLSGGGVDPIGKVRGILGVDQLTVSAEGEGVSGAAVAVGKYLSDEIFVSVKQGIERESSSATVEVELTDSVSVETDIGADGQSETWVNWQWFH